jgi:hypothetical protein
MVTDSKWLPLLVDLGANWGTRTRRASLKEVTRERPKDTLACRAPTAAKSNRCSPAFAPATAERAGGLFAATARVAFVPGSGRVGTWSKGIFFSAAMGSAASLYLLLALGLSLAT